MTPAKTSQCSMRRSCIATIILRVIPVPILVVASKQLGSSKTNFSNSFGSTFLSV